jgi:eukaryotic-like serine/threonine-protein kinase
VGRGNIALAGTDGTVELWDVAKGKEVATLMGDKGHVASISWSPDGRTLAAGIRARTTTGASLVRLWDAATGKELASLPQLSVMHSVSWSPEGRRLVACVTESGVGYLKLWNINLQK